jgi:glycosyltransferase involved in cell wall biosynthesis
MKHLLDMKILMTADAVGGVWTYATTLCWALAERGADVYLATLGPKPRAEQRAALGHSGVKLIETDLALEWQDPCGNDLPAARRCLTDLERRIRPDIVHLNSFREATFDWRAPVLLAAHSCVNSWARACHDTEWLGDPQWRHYTRLVLEGLNNARAWMSPTAAFRDMVHEIYRPATPGHAVWNGIGPSAACLPTKSAFILAAGRMWDAGKNLRALAEAAKGLAWPVLVAGPGANEEPVGGVLLGNLTRAELQKRMQRAAVFASPALYEPFGLSVLEAAAAGCALVLSDIATFRELWTGAAMFVDPTNRGALHDALAEVCADDRQRAQLQRAARERSRRYSISRMVDAYTAIYQDLLAAGQAASHSPAAEVCA